MKERKKKCFLTTKVTNHGNRRKINIKDKVYQFELNIINLSRYFNFSRNFIKVKKLTEHFLGRTDKVHSEIVVCDSKLKQHQNHKFTNFLTFKKKNRQPALLSAL